MLVRNSEILADLKIEYDSCFNKKDVSDRALNLTHEIIEKCSNVLDQIMFLAWTIRIKPKLIPSPVKDPIGYFPAAVNEHSYKSTLGAWSAKDLDKIDPIFARLLRNYQPMTNSKNQWLAQLKDLSKKKHTGLTPQKITEQRRVSVTSNVMGGGVFWNPSSVKFGPGVKVLGTPINPLTQLPIADPNINVNLERWVSFTIEGTNLNAFQFCTLALSNTQEIVDSFKSALELGNVSEETITIVPKESAIHNYTSHNIYLGRRLSDTQKTTIVNILSPYRGQKIDILSQIDDMETQNFAREFKDVFNMAGWDTSNSGKERSEITGVRVFVNKDEWKDGLAPQPSALHTLVTTLHNLKISETNIATSEEEKYAYRGTITLRIGFNR